MLSLLDVWMTCFAINSIMKILNILHVWGISEEHATYWLCVKCYKQHKVRQMLSIRKYVAELAHLLTKESMGPPFLDSRPWASRSQIWSSPVRGRPPPEHIYAQILKQNAETRATVTLRYGMYIYCSPSDPSGINLIESTMFPLLLTESGLKWTCTNNKKIKSEEKRQRQKKKKRVKQRTPRSWERLRLHKTLVEIHSMSSSPFRRKETPLPIHRLQQSWQNFCYTNTQMLSICKYVDHVLVIIHLSALTNTC